MPSARFAMHPQHRIADNTNSRCAAASTKSPIALHFASVSILVGAAKHRGQRHCARARCEWRTKSMRTRFAATAAGQRRAARCTARECAVQVLWTGMIPTMTQISITSRHCAVGMMKLACCACCMVSHLARDTPRPSYPRPCRRCSKCQHLFCRPCAEKYFSKALLCPLCDVSAMLADTVNGNLLRRAPRDERCCTYSVAPV